MSNAKFIVVEGLDGSGKGTQIRMLAKALEDQGHNIFLTSEPTQFATGGLVRDTLGHMTKRTPAELAGLFLADRIAHCSNPTSGLKNMLENGTTVICDRYYYSSFAYQGSQTDLSWVMHANLDCPDILKPDLCIFLDVSPDECDGRIEKGRASREIYESLEAIKRTRAQYMNVFEMLPDHNIKIINAQRTPEEISKEVLQAVNEILG